jgi:rhodanese-related sulfurtransferase
MDGSGKKSRTKYQKTGRVIMGFFTSLFSQFRMDQLDPDQVHSRMGQNPRPYLLDVRRPDEYRQSHISGAELIPLSDLNLKMKRIPKDREVICVCRSGNRSRAAARQLAAAGYNVSNLRGGMIGWKRAGLPVKTGPGK